MKCVLIYFSQTGNTEKIAMAIRTGIKQESGHCDLFKIKEAPRRLLEYDLIGIGSPVFGRVPENVRDFIYSMRFVRGKHAFAFSTSGDVPDSFLPGIYSMLSGVELTVLGYHNWYGAQWLPHCPYPDSTHGHPDNIDLNEAEQFGRDMVDRSRRISAGEKDLALAPPPAPIVEVQRPPEWTIDVFKSHVKYHREKCNFPQCHLCMDNCPMDGIDLTADPPSLCRPCMECAFCLAICPTGAIEADAYEDFTTMTFYEDLRRYIFATSDKAEAEGKFRRLLPKKDIGWDTPLSRLQRNQHPRWIIGKGSTVKPEYKLSGRK